MLILKNIACSLYPLLLNWIRLLPLVEQSLLAPCAPRLMSTSPSWSWSISSTPRRGSRPSTALIYLWLRLTPTTGGINISFVQCLFWPPVSGSNEKKYLIKTVKKNLFALKPPNLNCWKNVLLIFSLTLDVLSRFSKKRKINENSHVKNSTHFNETCMT